MSLIVAMACVTGLMSGCAVQHSYEFVDAAGNVSDTFTCLGISDQQWKTVLKPGRYWVELDMCSVYSASDSKSPGAGLQFGHWGTTEPTLGPWSPRLVIGEFTPFMFYKFPQSVGTGGVLWQGNGFSDLRTESADDDSPSVYLELYSTTQGDHVISRGIWMNYYASTAFPPGDWQKYSFLKGDAIADLVQLAFWAAQGLHAQYPDQFPNPLPAENPSPYVPPADGSLPTSTFTGTPTPPIYITPNPPNPSPSGTPT